MKNKCDCCGKARKLYIIKFLRTNKVKRYCLKCRSKLLFNVGKKIRRGELHVKKIKGEKED